MSGLGKLYVGFITVLRLVLYNSEQAWGQDQLVLVTKQHAVMRFNPGDEFPYKSFQSDNIERPHILMLSDTAILSDRGFIPLDSVEKVFYPETKFYNKVGMKIISAGIMVFLFDCIKISQPGGSLESFRNGAPTGSFRLLCVGLPIMFTKNKSRKVNFKHRLMMVEKNSPFYEPR
jgi:hypothetical protein